MSDKFAQYRKTPIASGARDAEPPKPEGYVAFGTKDNSRSLRIQRANDPGRSPRYAYLLDITYDDVSWTSFTLIYNFMMVLVRGKNLQAVVMAIDLNSADFIQEFDLDRWEKPKDGNAPMIESIQVVVKQSGPPIGDTEKASARPDAGARPH